MENYFYGAVLHVSILKSPCFSKVITINKWLFSSKTIIIT